MNLPKLPREPTRPEKEPEADNEIWKPEWKCFCCHDYGIVAAHLAALVIPDYDLWRDKLPACQRCPAGSDKIGSENYDQRFNRSICSELDKIERDGWAQTIKSKQKYLLDLKELAKSLAMPGACDRTADDELEIQQRQQEIAAFSQSRWLAMANEYLGEEALAQLGGDKL